MAGAIWPPGSRAKRCSRCFVFDAGYSATTDTRSMLFSPKPTTSKGLAAAGGMENGMRTGRDRSRVVGFGLGTRYSVLGTRKLFGILTFAFLLRRLSDEWTTKGFSQRGTHASTNQAAAGNPRLPERVHRSARIRSEPRGNRPAFRPLFARDGPQAPHEPSGEGVHQARVEPQPIGRDDSDENGRARHRASASRLCRRRNADRGGR